MVVLAGNSACVFADGLSVEKAMEYVRLYTAVLPRHPVAISLTDEEAVHLSPEAAAVLASYEGSLALYGVVSLSPEAAAALAKHQGWLLGLGVDDLTPEVAKALAQHRGIRGKLGVALPPEGAHIEGLILNEVTELTPEVADALGGHGGVLVLKGIKTLTPEVARKLAMHKDWLWMTGLEEVSDDALEVLKANPRIRLSERFSN